MLFAQLIGLLFFSFPILSDMKPMIPSYKKTDKSTKLQTPLKTKSHKDLNATWPSIENDFSPNPEKAAGVAPVSVTGHHKLTGVKTKCAESTAEALLSRLGSAFNVRYMSVERPVYITKRPLKKETGYQQDQHTISQTKELDFYVDSDFVRELEESSYYRQRLTSKSPTERFLKRIRRSAKSKKKKSSRRMPSQSDLPWKCPTQLVWRNLGTNHFPQFLRSVRCLSKHCWFSHFRCLPKAFTIKVLKRKSDECVPVPSSETKESRYEQHWVFEERAVTFCCECVDR